MCLDSCAQKDLISIGNAFENDRSRINIELIFDNTFTLSDVIP